MYHLTSAIRALIERRPQEAALSWQKLQALAGDFPWLEPSCIILRAIIALARHERVGFFGTADTAELLAERSPAYTVHFLSSSAIILSTAKLADTTASPKWLRTTQAAIERATELVGKIKPNPIAEARVSQSRGLLFLLTKSPTHGVRNLADALDVCRETLGESHSYITELLIDLANAHGSLRQWSDALRLALQALGSEEYSSNDPVRRARCLEVISRAQVQLGEPDQAYHSKMEALKCYESLSHYRSYDELFVVQDLLNESVRLGRRREMAVLKEKLAILRQALF